MQFYNAIVLSVFVGIVALVGSGCGKKTDKILIQEDAILIPPYKGDLPTIEEASKFGAPYLYINVEKNIIYVDDDDRSTFVELLGVQVDGDTWLKIDGDETTKYTVSPLSNLNLLRDEDNLIFKMKVPSAKCEQVAKGTCKNMRWVYGGRPILGSIKLPEDVNACVTAPEGEHCLGTAAKLSGTVYPVANCPEGFGELKEIKYLKCEQ